jgi:hypothetical protein
MNTPSAPTQRTAPEDVPAAARAWARGLVETAGPSFRALYLYGSALGPGFDRESSDVNLLLVLDGLPFNRLEALAESAAKLPRPEAGKPGYRFAPLILTTGTLETSTDVFPIDFLDLKHRRALLEGEDVLAGLQVPLVNLRHQCEYELRSRFIGLRQGWLRAGGARGSAHALVVHAAGASGSLFRHLLTLRGLPYPEDPQALARAVAEAYGVDPTGLDAPFAARGHGTPDETTARRRLAAYLDALELLIRAVDAHPTL